MENAIAILATHTQIAPSGHALPTALAMVFASMERAVARQSGPEEIAV